LSAEALAKADDGKETYMNLEELKQFIKQVGPSRLGLAGKEDQL